MKKMINEIVTEGRVYECDCEIKKVTNEESKNFGKDYINGTLKVATDEDGLNIVGIHFTFVTAETKAGKPNKTFAVLKEIIETKPTWVNVGKDEAMKVKITATNISLNEFYVVNEDKMVSSLRPEGGFVTKISKFTEDSGSSVFETDMFITNVTAVEANEEYGTPAYTRVSGAVFNFRGELLPVSFSVEDAAGRKYFEDLDATSANPTFTQVKGKIYSMTEMTKVEEESAFGGTRVRMVPHKVKKWVIDWAKGIPYDYGDENVLTAEDVVKANQNREIKLAKIKADAIEWQKNKNAENSFGNVAIAAPKSETVAIGEFKF